MQFSYFIRANLFFFWIFCLAVVCMSIYIYSQKLNWISWLYELAVFMWRIFQTHVHVNYKKVWMKFPSWNCSYCSEVSSNCLYSLCLCKWVDHSSWLPKIIQNAHFEAKSPYKATDREKKRFLIFSWKMQFPYSTLFMHSKRIRGMW